MRVGWTSRSQPANPLRSAAKNARCMLTVVLLCLNLAYFLVELSMGGGLDAFLRRWGLVPEDVFEALHGEASPAALVTLLTSLFLHAGWLHLLSNLLYLAVFGVPVERRLGSVRFGLAYFGSGLAGSLAYVVAQPDATAPAVGASAAIAGVIAAHLVLFPGATLGQLAPVVFFRVAAHAPTLVLLVVWLVAQLLSGVVSLTTSTGIAWWAHAGGFAGGLALTSLMRPRYLRQSR